jgi:hypothetical protein
MRQSGAKEHGVLSRAAADLQHAASLGKMLPKDLEYRSLVTLAVRSEGFLRVHEAISLSFDHVMFGSAALERPEVSQKTVPSASG